MPNPPANNVDTVLYMAVSKNRSTAEKAVYKNMFLLEEYYVNLYQYSEETLRRGMNLISIRVSFGFTVTVIGD